jgi:hypothetical protein
MSTSNRAAREEKVSELAEQYASMGYEVFRDPETHLFPFDTFGYRPSLLARKGEENIMVEVRTMGRHAPIGRIVELVEEARRHGWRFTLVTLDDVEIGPLSDDDVLPTWDHLRERIGRAERLLRTNETEAAFLFLWATLEGMLRRETQEAGLPIERLPSSGMIKHMVTYGVLDHEQLRRMEALLVVRDRVIHGFQASELARSMSELQDVVRELMAEWAPSRQAA